MASRWLGGKARPVPSLRELSVRSSRQVLGRWQANIVEAKAVTLFWERLWYKMGCGQMKANVGILAFPCLEELGHA